MQIESYKPYFFATKLCNQVCNFVSSSFLFYYHSFQILVTELQKFGSKIGKGVENRKPMPGACPM